MVASVAAYASYIHQRAFAFQGGADGTSATLWPLSVDGLLLLATVGLLKPAHQTGRRTRSMVWMAFLLGIQRRRAEGGTPTGAELDRAAGTNNYGRGPCSLATDRSNPALPELVAMTSPPRLQRRGLPFEERPWPFHARCPLATGSTPSGQLRGVAPCS
ncbi:DUF2637 domain-containing protein [Streptomyces sp. NPDC058001]|uniref:DUF2637 domain-containing protein n=1 Tax=Streptomyces sp. NPDC058001 TaxID=3346300 RepID=UPI0036F0EF2C